jgi:hypothetical protein
LTVPRDALAQLLKHADATATPPTLADDLPTRVRRRHVRRRRVPAATAIVALALLPATYLLFPLPGTPGRGSGRGASDSARLIALDREVQLHEQTATLLLASTAQPKTIAAPSPDVLSEIRQQRDRAALMLVYEADRARTDNRPDRALAAYRRTIELFPTTYWATVARQRIKEMPT